LGRGDQPHPVGLKKPNAWGLHDMHGNVWEWCQDAYDAAYYGQSPADDPPGSPGYLQRVYRGGSWYSRAWYGRSAQRSRNGATSRTITLGFRTGLVLATPVAGRQRAPK